MTSTLTAFHKCDFYDVISHLSLLMTYHTYWIVRVVGHAFYDKRVQDDWTDYISRVHIYGLRKSYTNPIKEPTWYNLLPYVNNQSGNHVIYVNKKFNKVIFVLTSFVINTFANPYTKLGYVNRYILKQKIRWVSHCNLMLMRFQYIATCCSFGSPKSQLYIYFKRD